MMRIRFSILTWRRIRWCLLIGLLLCWLVIGPWPEDQSHYGGQSWQLRTLERLDRLPIDRAGPGMLRIGIGERKITPLPGQPLAGYGMRAPKSDYPRKPGDCYVRAITLDLDGRQVILLSGDLLLFYGPMARKIRREGPPIYFMAGHTHAGPGGWSRGWIDEYILGRYDERYAARLYEQAHQAITESQKHLVPVTVGTLVVDLPGLQENRIDPALSNDHRLIALVFRPLRRHQSPPVAIVGIFGTHPTLIGREEPFHSPDYPGEFAARLKQASGAGLVMFGAGALGDSRPKQLQTHRPIRRMEQLGKTLADAVASRLDRVAGPELTVMRFAELWVDLPPVRVHLSRDWQLSPILSSLATDRSTQIRSLQLNRTVLVGMPGDFAGHLTPGPVLWAKGRGLDLVFTSFNGDFKGYFTSPGAYMDYGGYETRSMNFFGPYAGMYLCDLAMRLIERLDGPDATVPAGLPGVD